MRSTIFPSSDSGIFFSFSGLTQRIFDDEQAPVSTLQDGSIPVIHNVKVEPCRNFFGWLVKIESGSHSFTARTHKNNPAGNVPVCPVLHLRHMPVTRRK